MSTTSPDRTGDDLVNELLMQARLENATDVHLHSGGPAFFRAKGTFKKVPGDWKITGRSGSVDPGDFTKVCQVLGVGNAAQSKMSGFRSIPDEGEKSVNLQCRIQRAKFNQTDALLLRIQPESPPQISAVLKGTNALPRLTSPQGLVLVVGPMGGGKTTFAASLARHWADQGRHILTCEDPVEYTLKPNFGFVSQQDVRLAGFCDGISLEDAELHALRSDIDGLYVGETRNERTLQFALKLARSYEPVVTTYHAGSIGDAITSLYQVSALPWEVARAVIGNVLHTVVYINLAFTPKGVPVPVVMSLPLNDPAVRSSLAVGNQQTFSRLIEEACSGQRPCEGQITRRDALARAVAAGATQESAEAALPPEHKGDLGDRRAS